MCCVLFRYGKFIYINRFNLQILSSFKGSNIGGILCINVAFYIFIKIHCYEENVVVPLYSNSLFLILNNKIQVSSINKII